MATIDYEEAVQALQRHVGAQYSGTESDGRNTMVEALERELGYTSRQANEAIDAMIQANTLRYHAPGQTDSDAPASTTARDDADTTPFAVGTTGAYAPGPVIVGSGYWQIGTEDHDAPGRAGQVTPS